MKSLLFIGNWPKPYGGIASHLYELLPGITRSGYDVTIITYSEKKYEEKYIENGVKIIRFSPTSNFTTNYLSILGALVSKIRLKKDLSIIKFLKALSIANKVNEVIKEIDPVAIFTYGNDKLYINPFLYNPDRKIKVFNSIYGAFYLNPERYENERGFLRYALSFSDKVLSCSQFCVDSAESFLDVTYDKKVFYNNVDENVFKPSLDESRIREKYNIAKDSIVLITMGRMIKEMGIDFLLDNLKEITSISSRIVVFFIGAKGDLSERVIQESETNVQVRYAFDIPNEEKPYYYACCDIFTAPTMDKQACMGIANIEAMLSRKAIISSASGGHIETIEDQVSGILVPFENGKISKAEYLKYLSLLVHSEKLRESFASEGYRRALRLFTNDQIIKEHLDFIEYNCV